MAEISFSESDATLKLEFETPQFLHAIYGDDESNLRFLESQLDIKVVTREGWISFQGNERTLEVIKALFKDLESTVRTGTSIKERDFRMAVEMASSNSKQGLSTLSTTQLVGGRGKKPVVPKTPNQLEYIQAMEANDVVFGLGPAGTGKTYLAVAMALTKLKNKEINRVILTRPAVEAGEALGFLPGDLQEKIAPYLRPLYDAIFDMLAPSDAQKWMEDGTIEIAPLAYMRGRTLSKACIILDEAQNTTCEQMFMFLTRLGEGAQCFITGDTSQTDLKQGQLSGLVEAERALKGVDQVAFTHFQAVDVVRHPVVARIINAYDKHRSQG